MKYKVWISDDKTVEWFSCWNGYLDYPITRDVRVCHEPFAKTFDTFEAAERVASCISATVPRVAICDVCAVKM